MAQETFRLDKHHRAKIAARVLAGRFDEQEKKLRELCASLAESVYTRQYSPQQRALMATLPEGWLYHDDDIKARLGDNSSDVVTLDFDGRFPGEYSSRGAPVTKLFPDCDRGQLRLAVDDEDPLAKRWGKLKYDIAAFKKEKEVISNEVKGVLASFHTSAALIKGWPEVEQFMRDLVPVAKQSTALAPLLGDLNKKLRLRMPRGGAAVAAQAAP